MRRAELIRYLVLAAQREGNLRLTRDLRPLGVTPSQAEVIRVLGEQGPSTLNQLGRLLVCESGTNPSRLVDRLVDVGHVERHADPRDRRGVIVSLTPSGREVEAGIRRVEEALYADLDAATDGIDMAEALAFLRRLSADLPAGEAVAARIAGTGAHSRSSSGESRSGSAEERA